ncbi:MAG: hypothetical protein BMS9Abin26_1437 [Gammaproteobacteria bacterium]|nr:MAG: hypothetical protein BMS9Abin26_1437 [Gammaproteobacteria bacterium]
MTDQKYNIPCSGTKKVLDILETIKETPAGTIIYGHAERVLTFVEQENNRMLLGYAALLQKLLDAYCQQLSNDSPLHLELKLIQKRLQPPLSGAEISALEEYIEKMMQRTEQSGKLDVKFIRDALSPLLNEGESTVSNPAVSEQAPAEGVATNRIDSDNKSLAPDISEPPPGFEDKDEGDDGHITPAVEQRISSIYRHQLNEQRRTIQDLQKSLDEQVQRTISKNQEFGVLLEIVSDELEHAKDMVDLEQLRYTVATEIEKMKEAQLVLSTMLNETHSFLHLVGLNSKKLNDELNRVRVLSLTDELTDLPNRRAFMRRLEDEVGRVRRYNTPLTMSVIDIDGFKMINDQYGHAIGDEILKIYAQDILSIFRRHDMVSRYGGEEFAVLLANTDKDGAMRALIKVKQAASALYYEHNGTRIKVPTFSAGIATYTSDETMASLIERADNALYRAKELGRDRIEINIPQDRSGDAHSTQDQSHTR